MNYSNYENYFNLRNSKNDFGKKLSFKNKKNKKNKKGNKKNISKEQLEKKIKNKKYSVSKTIRSLERKDQLSLKLENNNSFFEGLEEEYSSINNYNDEYCNNAFYTGANNDYDPNQKLIPKKFHNNPEIKRYYEKQINFLLINKYYNEYKKIDDKIRESKTFSFYYLLKKIENYLYLLGLPYIVVKQILGYLKSYLDWSINSKMVVIEEIYESLHNKNYHKFEFDLELQVEYDILSYPQNYYYDLW